MQNEFETKKNKMGACVVCGKPVPKRDIRDKTPQYCGRVHASLAKFGTRYTGSMSGPLDRPRDIMGKATWESQ